MCQFVAAGPGLRVIGAQMGLENRQRADKQLTRLLGVSLPGVQHSEVVQGHRDIGVVRPE